MNAWQIPSASLCFFSLIMGILSFWVKRSPWIWASFFLVSISLAYLIKIITPIALVPVVSLLILHGILKGNVRGFSRFFLVLLTAAISVGLLLHLFPGFHNWKIEDHFGFGEGAYASAFYLNFDTPFAGIFILAWAFPLIGSKEGWKKTFKITLPLSLCGMIVMLLVSVWSGLVRWDPKWPSLFWLWAISNLFLVCIIEEAFMRGFIQNELYRAFGGSGMVANSGSVLLAALFFSLIHIKWVPSAAFLSLVFVAGIIYGSIYQYTRKIESSIFCHFFLNVTHLIFFTYPVLKSAINL